MSANRFLTNTGKRRKEAGQVMLVVLLALGLFLVGGIAIAVDMGNLWFHRQAAQSAADAACTAGAMDLLVDATAGTTTQGHFTAGTNFDCNASTPNTATSDPAPCQYAALNDYNSNMSPSSTAIGNNVYVSFPPRTSPPPGVTPPDATLAPHPFIRVDVLENVQSYFSGLLNGRTNQPIRAFAVCGTVSAKSPIPIVVLHPTKSGALHFNGTPTIDILGGPSRSIQVNSSSATAVDLGGHGGVVLECGGTSFVGSNLGVFGGPTTQTPSSGTCPTVGGGAPSPTNPIVSASLPTGGGFYPGSTGVWSTASPIADPFALVPAPSIPSDPVVPTDTDMAGNVSCSTSASIKAGNCVVAYHVHGCPDPGNCKLFTRGHYDTGICIGSGGSCGGPITTALFDPGVYYIENGLALKSNSMVRPGTGVGDGTGGTMFYLTGTSVSCSGQSGLICVGSNSGKGGLDPFVTSGVKCPAGPALDPTLGVPANLDGSVLLAPCSGTYGDPLAQYRGLLFFQDRASNVGGGWGGGGGFLLAGSMYFHQNTTFGTTYTLQGGSSGSSYVLGEIVADSLQLGGNSAINMALNPNAAFNTLKVSLLQ